MATRTISNAGGNYNTTGAPAQPPASSGVRLPGTNIGLTSWLPSGDAISRHLASLPPEQIEAMKRQAMFRPEPPVTARGVADSIIRDVDSSLSSIDEGIGSGADAVDSIMPFGLTPARSAYEVTKAVPNLGLKVLRGGFQLAGDAADTI